MRCSVGLSFRSTIGSGSPGTKISSIRFASAIIGIFCGSFASCARMAACAALSCPFPPSINIRSGNLRNFSSCAMARRSLRVSTSFIIAKSFCPATVRILNRRYSPEAGSPSSMTTMEPTANLSPRLEISNASIRRNDCGKLRSSWSSASAGCVPLLYTTFCSCCVTIISAFFVAIATKRRSRPALGACSVTLLPRFSVSHCSMSSTDSTCVGNAIVFGTKPAF